MILQILALSLLLSTAYSDNIDCRLKTDLWEINYSELLLIYGNKNENVNFSLKHEDCVPIIREIYLKSPEVLISSLTVVDDNSEVKSKHYFEAIEYFSARNGTFKSIERKNFKKMVKLTYLRLHFGNLETICSDTFLNLPLNYVYLNHNKIKFIHPDLFKTLNKLKSLDLSNNLIEYLHPRTFHTLKNLESLNLSGNRLIYLEQSHLINNVKLDYFKANFNNIEYIEENTFDHLYLFDFNISDISCAKFLPMNEFLFDYEYSPIEIDWLKSELIKTNCTLKTDNIVKKIKEKIGELNNYFLNNNC